MALELRDFQTWLQTFIVEPGDTQQALAAAEKAAGLESGAAERLVLRSPTLSEVERMLIYRNMYLLRMEEALSIDYPAVKHCLGQERFFELVDRYVQVHPSRSYTLDHLGHHFADFVKQDPLADEYPGLGELTRLEEAMCQVFAAVEVKPLTPADMARVNPQEWAASVLKPVPALRLLELQYSANDYYRSFNADEDCEPMVSGRNFVVVWRESFRVWRMPLDEPAYRLLQMLCEGRTLGEAVVSLMQTSAELEEQQVFEWFSSWIGEGMFCEISSSS